MSSSGERDRTAATARRFVLSAGAVLAGVVLALALPARPAAAHADLVSSEPANGATLAQAPGTVVLRFSEGIAPRFSSARLVDSAGQPVAGTRVAPEQPGTRQLVMHLPNVPPGTYGVVWQVLAEDDGHTTRGVIVFAVNRPVSGTIVAAGGPGTSAQPLDVARRWVGLCLLAALIGGLAVAGMVLTPALRRAVAADPDGPLPVTLRAARHRVLTVAAGGAVLGTVVGIADLFAEIHRLAGPGGAPAAAVHLVTGTRWGRLWLARMAVLPALAMLVSALRARPSATIRGRTLWPATAVLVLVVVTLEALGSHTGALSSGRAAAVAVAALHILTACMWLGAVASLALVMWPRGGDGSGRRATIRACRAPFTRLAVLSVGLVAATGLYNAGRQVDSVDTLVATAYGRVLLIKSALLLVVGGIGLVNSARLHGRVPWRWVGRARAATSPPRRLVAVEAVAGIVLLFVVGILAETPPPRPVDDTTASSEASLTLTDAVDDVEVSILVTPNRAGVNGFTVLAESRRRPPPAPIDDVTLELTAGGTTTAIPLRQLEPGRYFGTGTVDAAGPERLNVVIHRSGQQLPVAVGGWSFPPPETQPTTDGRLAATVNPLASTLAAAVLAVGLRWLLPARRRRRRTGTPATPAERDPEGVR
ncbi:copper resistance protein CopC [Dactylosporangium sp. McL0621]|uniref:copper resistance CopC/CopD family protein n=1 Tax=Dactylosporangium sp. McL0621 TaxID=3415678 RepID=UPI003CEE4D87